MKLKDYPNAIATSEFQLLEMESNVSHLLRNIKLIEAETDNEVAFDSSLTNEIKRKTRRSQLLDIHPQYWEYQAQLEAAKKAKDAGFIRLCELRNEFSVIKLEARERIAKLELQQPDN